MYTPTFSGELMTIGDRVSNEKSATNQGDVYAASGALQRRFQHVFFCQNSMRLERHFEDEGRRCSIGRDVLNLGCHQGDETRRYQSYGPRKIVGIDISDSAIAVARSRHGELAEFHVMDAHRTIFEPGSFDLVIGRSILHHLDFKLAVVEMKRILRPDGAAIFMEPLGDNPAAKLLRALTPQARTKDERALRGSQIAWADQQFGGEFHMYGNLLSVPVAMITSLTPLPPDNQLLSLTDRVDQLLSNTPIKTWMRMVALSWRRALT